MNPQDESVSSDEAINDKKMDEANKDNTENKKKKTPPPKKELMSEEQFKAMSKEERKQYVTQKINKGKVNDVEKLVKADDDLFDYMIEIMSNNKNAKRASEIVAKYNKDFMKYPELVKRLEKKAIRFLISDQPWSMIERRLTNDPRLMAIAAEDYLYREMKDVALTLVTRHNLKPHLMKQDIITWLESEDAKKSNLLPNELLEKDEFGTV